MKSLIPVILLLIAVAATALEPQTQSRPTVSQAVYRHPVGLEFQYPSDWTVREASFGEAELVPPDPQRNEKGFTEGFLLWGIGGGFSGPADPILTGFMNTLVTKMAPFLKKDGDPVVFESSNSSEMTLLWSGASEDGVSVTARTFVTIHGPFAFALVMLGTQERMAFREASIREIFSSFRFVDKPNDPAIAGNWKSPSAAAQTQTASETGVQMELRVDGSFWFREGSGAAGEGGELTGHWYASDGRLSFVYPESFFLNFRYELEGEPGARKLTLQHASGGFQTLIETPASK